MPVPDTFLPREWRPQVHGVYLFNDPVIWLISLNKIVVRLKNYAGETTKNKKIVLIGTNLRHLLSCNMHVSVCNNNNNKWLNRRIGLLQLWPL